MNCMIFGDANDDRSNYCARSTTEGKSSLFQRIENSEPLKQSNFRYCFPYIYLIYYFWFLNTKSYDTRKQFNTHRQANQSIGNEANQPVQHSRYTDTNNNEHHKTLEHVTCRCMGYYVLALV